MRREAHIWHPVHDVYGSGAANAWDVVVELGGCGGRVGGGCVWCGMRVLGGCVFGGGRVGGGCVWCGMRVLGVVRA